MIKKIFAKEINPFQEYIFFTSGGTARTAKEIVFVTMKVIFKDANNIKEGSRFAKARKYYEDHYKKDRALRGKIPSKSDEVNNNNLGKNVLPAVKKFIINHRKFKPNGKRRVQDLKKTLKDVNTMILDEFLEYLEAYKKRHPNDDTFLSGVKLDGKQAVNNDEVCKINSEKRERKIKEIEQRANKLGEMVYYAMDDKFIDRFAKDFEWIKKNNDVIELKETYCNNLKSFVERTAFDIIFIPAELKLYYKQLKHLLKIVNDAEIKSESSMKACEKTLKILQNKLDEIDAAYKNLLEVINNGINEDIQKLQKGNMLSNRVQECQIRKLESCLMRLIVTVQGTSHDIYTEGFPMSSLVTGTTKFTNNEKIAKVLIEVGKAALELVKKLEVYLSEKKVNKLHDNILKKFNDAVNNLKK